MAYSVVNLINYYINIDIFAYVCYNSINYDEVS